MEDADGAELDEVEMKSSRLQVATSIDVSVRFFPNAPARRCALMQMMSVSFQTRRRGRALMHNF